MTQSFSPKGDCCSVALLGAQSSDVWMQRPEVGQEVEHDKDG